LGEERGELSATLAAVRQAGTDILTVGQYLRPSLKHAPVLRYYTPAEFRALKEEALALGFSHVESGPLVRSSYHADQQVLPRSLPGSGGHVLDAASPASTSHGA
jgi:lipoic acid synthetase